MQKRRGEHVMLRQFHPRAQRAIDRQFGAGGAAPGRPAFDHTGPLLNVRADPVDERDELYEPSFAEVQPYLFPTELPSVRNQGGEGSCTGQALAAVIDIQNRSRRSAGADVPERVSARMLYESAKAFDKYPDDGSPGSSLRGVLKGFYHRGVCSERTAPYDDGDTEFRLTSAIAKESRRVQLGAYMRLQPILNHYHVAMNEVGPILCSATIHEGWFPMQVESNAGRIVAASDPTLIRLEGAHAFAIVGYDDEGFLVLSSWGGRWGAFDPYSSLEQRIAGRGGQIPSNHPRGDRLPGVAHWSYDDWAANVLDAWALRLTAPTGRVSCFNGAFYRVSRADSDEGPGRLRLPSPPASSARGHVVHLRNARLVETPPYDSDAACLEQTAEFLGNSRENPKDNERYSHLLLYAHSGWEVLEDCIRESAALAQLLKRHGIYPLSLLWCHHLGTALRDILRGALATLPDRTSEPNEVSDNLLTRAVQPVGRALLQQMRQDAERTFLGEEAPARFARSSLRKILVNACAGENHPLKLHLVAHGNGVLLLQSLLEWMQAEAAEAWEAVETVSLLAPTCSATAISRGFAGIRRKARSFAIYNLGDEHEREDHLSPVYRRSLPMLASNFLEEEGPMPLLGLNRDWTAIPEVERYGVEYIATRDLPHVGRTSTHHFDLPRDPAILNSILCRVLNQCVPLEGNA